jgi:hypothetical protein
MFSVVAHRQGKRVVQWDKFLMTTVLLVTFSTLSAVGLYYLLAGQWNPKSLVVGAGAGFLASVLTLLVALLTPLQRLPMLK